MEEVSSSTTTTVRALSIVCSLVLVMHGIPGTMLEGPQALTVAALTDVCPMQTTITVVEHVSDPLVLHACPAPCTV